jgi:DNA (cytosine-5)-methyltransferase 1
MAELDERRLEVALLNHPRAVGIAGDLRETWPDVVEAYRRASKAPPALLAACPPCQGMSSVRSGRGKEVDPDAGSRDARNLLVVVIAAAARTLRPRAVVVENVGAFFTRKVRHPSTRKPISAALLLIELLETDYAIFPLWTDLADFGVPQRRKRAFLTFVRRDEKHLKTLLELGRSPYPRPRHAADYGGAPHVTVASALSALAAGSLDAREAGSAARKRMPMHSVPIYDARQYAMVAAIPPGSGASAWQNDRCPSCGPVKVGPRDAECPICADGMLRPVVRKRRGGYRLVKGFTTTAYRRMRWDAPAPTITTASGHLGSSITIHPEENRVLSPLECAHLQTFPRGFRGGTALERWGHTNVREMIGEAVPPRFTGIHGQALKGVLTGKWKTASLSRSDPRCASAWRILGLDGEAQNRKERDT